MFGQPPQRVLEDRQVQGAVLGELGRAQERHLRAVLASDRGNFFIIDQSTNGTYVTLDGDEEILLKREQHLLRGRGVICLGHAALTKDAELVTFVCG